MYTIGQGIYNVRALLKGYSDDFDPSNRMIYNRLKTNRSLLINRENNKGKLFNSSALQFINCIPMKSVDISECCDYKTGITVSRSKDKLPKFIDTTFDHRAVSFYTLDKGYKIDIKSLDTIIGQYNKKYKYPVPSAFITNDYIYVMDLIDALSAQGICEDPEVISNLNTCHIYDKCGNEIDTKCPIPILEREFNCPGYLIEPIETKTAKDIAQFYGMVREDRSNNMQNNTVT